LNLGVGVNTDIENLAVFGKPGICPTAVITNPDGGDSVDDPQRARLILIM